MLHCVVRGPGMDETYGLGGYGVTPVASHKTSSASLFGSLKRRDSKHSYKGSSVGSASIKTKSYQVSRPPAGLVSYQIPSDNISYDPRKYTSGLSHPRSHSHSRSQSSYTLAGVHPQHLHNGGRSYKSAVKSSERYVPPWPSSSPRTRWTGEGGKKYRKSPVPGPRSDYSAEEEATPPPPPLPLPSACQTNGEPKPPPRLRPKSWTSTLFSAFRLKQDKASAGSQTVHLKREVSTVTLSSLSTQDKKGFRSSFNKQVRSLATPAKPLDSNQKFYSLPHFARPLPAVPLPEEVIPETDGVKTRSRSPSPFGRLVKSLVRGSRGGNLAGLSLNTTDSRQCLICFHWIIGLSQHQTWTLCSHKSLSH